MPSSVSLDTHTLRNYIAHPACLLLVLQQKQYDSVTVREIANSVWRIFLVVLFPVRYCWLCRILHDLVEGQVGGIGPWVGPCPDSKRGKANREHIECIYFHILTYSDLGRPDQQRVRLAIGVRLRAKRRVDRIKSRS